MPNAVQYAELEIAFRRKDLHSYALSFRFNGPGDEAEQRSEPDPVIELDPAAVRDYFPDQYGQKLGAVLYSDEVKRWFAQFRASAQQQKAILRIRLTIESSAPELHSIRWETLRDPDVSDAPLFMGEQTIVSRFLASGQDWRPIKLRPKSELSALVAVANPSCAGRLPLEAIDVPGERKRAQDALQGITVTELAPGGPLPLNDLAAELRKGYDILYLVCHGILDKAKQEPFICLEEADMTAGADLVQRIRELDQRPRLIVLASCQSAGKGGVGLAGLGPRLSEAGVPAVIAMQDSITMDTSGIFMKRFFVELLRDGQIDRAMSVARGDVRKNDDYWMPALFLRLRNGRIWYEPGFEGAQTEFEQLKSICRFVQQGACVPIIGPDVAEHVFGGTQQLASDLAESNNFPLQSYFRSDLAKVAQFVMTQHGPEYVRGQVTEGLISQLFKAGERLLGKPVQAMKTADLLGEVAKVLEGRDDDPLKIVASLNAKVFVNACSDSMLELFLAQTPVPGGGFKQPIPLVTEWRDERRDDRHDADFQGDATVDRPYVYYVFGKSREESTWVLTEDDFFDYLIRTTRYQLMPPVVSEALLTGSLLFLGFSLDDWRFRVLFRMILAKGGQQLLQGYNHVGVQVDPSEATIANARRAKGYLERYFSNSKVDIFWGTAADFLCQLKRQLDAMPPLAAGRGGGI